MVIEAKIYWDQYHSFPLTEDSSLFEKTKCPGVFRTQFIKSIYLKTKAINKPPFSHRFSSSKVRDASPILEKTTIFIDIIDLSPHIFTQLKFM